MESEKSEVPRRFAKYVFLDVVQFSKRSAEAQSDIVHKMNDIVRESLTRHEVTENDRILIPTGDGMCIALISHDLPYDVHIQTALSILELLETHNNETENETRKFQIRIGINQNTDILVTDINDRPNVAGAGINMASRIMDQADGNQIIVSRTVYDELQPSEKYMNKFKYFNAEAKHNLKFTTYQFVDKGQKGLDISTPSNFVEKTESEPKLSKLAAYYFAHAIKNKAILLKRGQGVDSAAIIVLLYLLAQDSLGLSEATETVPYKPGTHGYGELSFDEQINYYYEQDVKINIQFGLLITGILLANYTKYMEAGVGNWTYMYIKDEGVEKLKNEWPDIWKQFELDKFI